MQLFQPAIKNLTWDEFFHKAGSVGDAPVPATTQRLATLGKIASPLVLATIPHTAHAASLSPTNLMIHAMWPIISLVQGLAFPISFLGMSGGMILMSVGNRGKGIAMIKWAAIGYIGMQFVPAMMVMLHHVGTTIAHQSHLP